MSSPRPIRVISLVRHRERRAEFLRRNAHLPSAFFDAVDGSALTIEQIRASGLFTPDVERWYEAHGYGCALSHWQLWNEAAAGVEPLTIAEDDALFRHDFEERAAGVLAALPAGWDFVLWGWNFDSVLQVHPIDGVLPAAMLFDQEQLRSSLDAFQRLASPVQPLRLERAFGLPAYTLSPSGAAKLLKLCFPMRPLSVFIPIFNRYVGNIGVDVAANAVYRDAQCFACFPPLVASPNQRGQGPGPAR